MLLPAQVRAVEEAQAGLMPQAERFFLLTQIDNLWKEHLQAMNFLRQAVGLRGCAQCSQAALRCQPCRPCRPTGTLRICIAAQLLHAAIRTMQRCSCSQARQCKPSQQWSVASVCCVR